MNGFEAFNTLDRILRAALPSDGLEALQVEGFFEKHIPEVQAIVGFGDGTEMKDLWEHTKQVVDQTVLRQVPRWAALFHDVGNVKAYRKNGSKVEFHGHELLSAKLVYGVTLRLHMPLELADDVCFVVRDLGLAESYSSEWTDSAVRRLTRDLGDRFEDVLSLSEADCTTKHQNKRDANTARVQELRRRASELAALDAIPQALPKGLGTALQELGLSGPELGKVMNQLKLRVEAGELPRNGEIGVYVRALSGGEWGALEVPRRFPPK